MDDEFEDQKLNLLDALVNELVKIQQRLERSNVQF